MKHFKHLHFVIGDEIIATSPIPLPEDGSDCECPSCYQRKWTDLYEVIQYGFGFEDHLNIIKCDNCKNTYHVQYTLVNSEE